MTNIYWGNMNIKMCNGLLYCLYSINIVARPDYRTWQCAVDITSQGAKIGGITPASPPALQIIVSITTHYLLSPLSPPHLYFGDLHFLRSARLGARKTTIKTPARANVHGKRKDVGGGFFIYLSAKQMT